MRLSFPVFRLFLSASLFITASSAQAFQPSSDRLLVDWPDLAVEADPAGGEAQIYAIVEDLPANPGVIYVITWNYKGIARPLGAFRCSRRFEILESVTNGFHDILCDDSGPITGTDVRTLHMGPDGYRAR